MPNPDKPEPKRDNDTPSAVRAVLDDPPIHIRPFPASAGAKNKKTLWVHVIEAHGLSRQKLFFTKEFCAENTKSKLIRD